MTVENISRSISSNFDHCTLHTLRLQIKFISFRYFFFSFFFFFFFFLILVLTDFLRSPSAGRDQTVYSVVPALGRNRLSRDLAGNA